MDKKIIGLMFFMIFIIMVTLIIIMSIMFWYSSNEDCDDKDKDKDNSFDIGSNIEELSQNTDLSNFVIANKTFQIVGTGQYTITLPNSTKSGNIMVIENKTTNLQTIHSNRKNIRNERQSTRQITLNPNEIFVFKYRNGSWYIQG